jgi:hypothetical protein
MVLVMNLLNRDRVFFEGEAVITSGMTLFQGRQQSPFFTQGEKRVQVVDQDKTVFRPRYAGDILHADRDSGRINEVGTLNVHDIAGCINHQRDRQVAGSGDDELILGPQFSCRKPEALSHIHDRDDRPADIQDAEDDFRCFGKGG